MKQTASGRFDRRLQPTVLLLLLIAACSREPESARQPAQPSTETRPTRSFPGGFVDVTKQVGIDFRHETGGKGEKLLPETMGSGAAFFDWGDDGVLDILFVRGNPDRFNAFDLVSGGLSGFKARSPLEKVVVQPPLYGMGTAIADYDGDQDDDIYITGAGSNCLLRSDGGRFTDVTQQAGVTGGTWRDRNGAEHPAWSTASLWCDYDVDGDLDLFVVGYVQWTKETDIFTSLDGVTKAFTTPDRYTGLPCRLYRNKGDATFEDATEHAGLLPHLGKGLGVAMWDFDRNGYPDIVVANDTRPNFVFMNQGNGTFREEGLALRVAYDENGRARAGMGIDIADYANDGVAGIAIGNFSSEPMSLYRAGKDGFTSVAEKAGLAAATTPALTFGLQFADIDLDGLLDLIVVNGHIEPDIAKFHPEQTHAQRPLLFLGVAGGGFVDASASAGPDFGKPRVGRGLAIADYDKDGDLDLLITENGGPAVLLQNRLMETASAHWVRVVLRATGKNTRAIGATITLTAGGKVQTRMVRTGSSYLSQGDIFPTFGLGTTTSVDELRVRWPGGAERVHPVDGVDRTITLTE